MSTHTQIMQNKKFAISLWYLTQRANDEVEFLISPPLKINTMVLIGMVKHSQSSQTGKFAISWQYLK